MGSPQMNAIHPQAVSIYVFYVKYRKCIILSAVGFIAGMTAAVLPESTGALQWKIPFGMSDLVVEPGMIINIVVLIMSVKYFYTQKERKILDK